MPDTFTFDEEWIIKLRSDVLDSINLGVCIWLARKIHNSAQILESLSTVRSSRSSASKACHGTLASSTRPLLSTSPAQNKMGLPELDRELSICRTGTGGRDERSETNPPATSRSSAFASTTSTSVLSPFSQSTTGSQSVEDILSRSIIAILADTSGVERWQQNLSAISLQLSRFMPTLSNHVNLESILQGHLSNHISPVFRAAESRYLSKLMPHLSDFAVQFSHLTLPQIFDVATSAQLAGRPPDKARNAFSDVAKQIAHRGVLHWRVWGPLAYLIDPIDLDDFETRTLAATWAADKNLHTADPDVCLPRLIK